MRRTDRDFKTTMITAAQEKARVESSHSHGCRGCEYVGRESNVICAHGFSPTPSPLTGIHPTGLPSEAGHAQCESILVAQLAK